MSNHFKDAVYLVVPSGSFQPCSPWNWPERFTGGKLIKKNVSIQDARAFCRTFNAQQMQSGRPIRQWALAARFVRRRNRAPYVSTEAVAGDDRIALERVRGATC